MANPVVLPVPAGPMTATECWASVATSFPFDGAEGETSRLGAAYQEGLQVSGFRPSGPVIVLSSVALPETPPVSDDDDCSECQENEDWVVGGGSRNQPDGLVRPGAVRVSRVADESDEDAGAVEERRGEPLSSPDPSGQLSGGPHQDTGDGDDTCGDGEGLLTVGQFDLRLVGHRPSPGERERATSRLCRRLGPTVISRNRSRPATRSSAARSSHWSTSWRANPASG